MRLYLRLLLSLGIASSASAVSMAWTPIGSPGNAADGTGFGAVPYGYYIGTYEVTNAQYAEFLNAVADADPNGLYEPGLMGNTSPGFHGGIGRSGVSGSYTYSAIPGRETRPVNYVTFYDSLRFVNWLQNGQPVGPQSASTTESGAYTFTGSVTVGDRNAGTTIVLPTRDEWYKAAYYDPSSNGYLGYPMVGFPTCAAPGPTPSTANCGLAAASGLTNVGAYTGSPSPSGTYDQGGNVWEWTEALSGSLRGQMGGAFNYVQGTMGAGAGFFVSPQSVHDENGFRVAMIPEPSTGLLVIAGLLGLAGWRRVRA